jgi:uncharacterized membrane protein YeaQ/YmgE (transglycosylase-associated protein family)
MMIEALVISPIIGAIVGWLAGQLMKEGDFGLGGDIVLGIVGAVIGGWVLPQVGILIGRDVILGSIVNAFIGACVVLLVLRPLIRGA